MAAPRGNSERICSLMAALAGKDGLARQRARRALVAIGRPAVGRLVKALSAPRERLRWEAAKTLTEIPDVSAVPALIAALEDKNSGVCWLAAEALITLGRDSLIPLLRELTAHSGSASLRGAAHHILKAQRARELRSVLAPVLEALSHFDPELVAPVAAKDALEELRKRKRSRRRGT